MAHEESTISNGRPSTASDRSVDNLPHTGVRFPESSMASSSPQAKVVPLGLGPPPSRRIPPPQDISHSRVYHDEQQRRRVRSVHATPSDAQAHRTSSLSTTPYKRRPSAVEGSHNASGPHRTRRLTIANGPLSGMDKFQPNVFSDEYDLSHEDPTILEEVEHALKLKLQREARIHGPIATGGSISSISSGVPPAPFATGTSPLRRVAKASLESELDFSPSVGIDNLHPVAISYNDGHTLDWSSNENPEDLSDKKWPISMSKRKLREKPPFSPSKEHLEKQQVRWSERMKRIQANTDPRTLRKADITRQQLGRRYQLLYDTLKPEQVPLNLAEVVAWYNRLEPSIQTALDLKEPFTWLKHLRDRRLARTGRRSPWYTSALVVEEYAKHHSQQLHVKSNPETGPVLSSSLAHTSPTQRSFESSLDLPGHSTLPTSLSRRFSGSVSFETPQEPLNRPSVAGESHHSLDGAISDWKRAVRTESPRSSVYSASSHQGALSSPSSSRIRMRGLTGIKKPKFGHDSDDANSLHHSLSEDSETGRRKKRTRIFRPVGLDLMSLAQPVTEAPNGEEANLSHDEPMPEVLTPSMGESSTAKASHAPFLATPSPKEHTATQPRAPSRVNSRLLQLRGYRTSFPSIHPTTMDEDEPGMEANEQEYELRAQLLESITSQNIRNRQLLQRVTASIKEYDHVFSRMSKSFGLSYSSLPDELLEALPQELAFVTGHIRGLSGHASVQIVHETLKRQLEAVQGFRKQRGHAGDLKIEGSVLGSRLKRLLQALEQLENRQVGISEKAQAASDILSRVKKLHTDVKKEYNQAVVHSSVVYPEMSQIIALEDSYKNHYQQVWEFGMDAATFLLDAVVPFWRNYGKVIGVDVQDFLIIPWYRNEFTGEAKRYPITQLPRRSFRHWIGLMIFFDLTVTLLCLQCRGVWMSLAYYRLPFDATLGLWGVTFPLFWGVVISQVVAVVVEAAVVAAQLAVVVWWLGWWAGILS